MDRNFPRWNGKLIDDLPPPKSPTYLLWWGASLALWCVGLILALLKV